MESIRKLEIVGDALRCLEPCQILHTCCVTAGRTSQEEVPSCHPSDDNIQIHGGSLEERIEEN